MIDKQPTVTQEAETKERPQQYARLEKTLEELVIGNDKLLPSAEHDENDNITAVRYHLYPNQPGQGSVIGFNFQLRVPEYQEEATHITVFDGFEPTPEWEWDMGATNIDGRKVTGELTPERAGRITQLLQNSDYYREHKGRVNAPKASNPFTRWFRSKHA